MSLPSRVVVVVVEEVFFFLLLFIIFHVLWKDQPALVIENFLPFFPPSLLPSLPLFHSLFKSYSFSAYTSIGSVLNFELFHNLFFFFSFFFFFLLSNKSEFVGAKPTTNSSLVTRCWVWKVCYVLVCRHTPPEKTCFNFWRRSGMRQEHNALLVSALFITNIWDTGNTGWIWCTKLSILYIKEWDRIQNRYSTQISIILFIHYDHP